jgi:DnaJ-class molecular chaperone
MATRKTAKPKAAAAEPVKCGPCDGTGETSRTVRVGRKHRPAGQQVGICLACFGSGQATD